MTFCFITKFLLSVIKDLCYVGSGVCISHCKCLFSYDSDNPRVEGDVGMAGVAIDTVEDMKVSCT